MIESACRCRSSGASSKRRTMRWIAAPAFQLSKDCVVTNKSQLADARALTSLVLAVFGTTAVVQVRLFC
jgi:hypothetical protein